MPASLLEKLDIPHEIIKASPTMSGEFSKVFKQNDFSAHDYYAQVAEKLLERYSRKKVIVTGHGAEIGKTCYRARIDAQQEPLYE